MQPARVIPTTRRKSDLHAYDILPTTHQHRARLMNFSLQGGWEPQQTKWLTPAVIVAIVCKRKKNKKRRRSAREKGWLGRRKDMGAYREIIQELRVEDAQNYRRYLRMDTTAFEVSEFQA